ncbi:MAG: ABC transporter ATP-binding protein [Planctomycetes bacterium]|nr:ABC transporter ATP-binding protein [Planctomycetota bacterium]
MTLALDFALRRGTLDLAIRLEVAPGETLALVGPNGAGKSSCLAAIVGIVGIARGHIALDGRLLDEGTRRVPTEDRGIGCLFQEPLLFPHLSALDNVAFGLRAQGLARSAARARAREFLARVGLADCAAMRPRALSGGQAQRVALARALAPAPRVLLLDEPLAAVDASARIALRRELRDHLAAFAGPRILVTHDAIDALALADRLAVLEEGRLVQVDVPARICSAPGSRYVADLLGLNVFRGRLAHGVLQLEHGGQLVVVSELSGPAMATAHPRAIALFLEHPAGSPRNVWETRIAAIEPAIDRVRVRLEGPIPLVAELTHGAVDGLGLAPGRRVFAAIKATEIAVVAL